MMLTTRIAAVVMVLAFAACTPPWHRGSEKAAALSVADAGCCAGAECCAGAACCTGADCGKCAEHCSEKMKNQKCGASAEGSAKCGKCAKHEGMAH